MIAMFSIDQPFAATLIERLGWTLLHSLWQGAAVAVVLALLLLAIPSTRPNMRYVASCLSLLAILGLSVATFCVVETMAPLIAPETMINDPFAEALTMDEPADIVTPSPDLPPLPLESASAEVEALPESPPAPEPPVPWQDRITRFAQPVLPWLALVWMLGVGALSVWHVGGWIALCRLRSIGTSPVPGHVTALVAQLQQRLQISRPVRVLQSAVIQIPAVLGHLRPVILLPVSTLTGLSSEQIEAILAHELAHIRRADYLVSLLQTVAETLLFHHPAVWWISRRIRAEREFCCDDLALTLTTNRKTYAHALASLAGVSTSTPRPAIAADGGSLLSRVTRILGPSPETSRRRSHWLTSALIATLCIAGTLSIYAAGGQDKASVSVTATEVPETQPAPDSKANQRPSLEFRILAEVSNQNPDQISTPGKKLTGPVRQYIRLFEERGPVGQLASHLMWIEIADAAKDELKDRSSLIVATHDETSYVLGAGDPEAGLLDDGSWALEDASVGNDKLGRTTIDLTFDERGGAKLAELTRENLGRPLATIIDGKLVHHAIIMSELRRKAQITGSSNIDRVYDLVSALQHEHQQSGERDTQEARTRPAEAFQATLPEVSGVELAVTLPGDVTLEFLGVARNDERDMKKRPWWSPSGFPLSEPVYGDWGIASNQERPFEFGVRVQGAKGFRLTAESPQGTSVSEPRIPGSEAKRPDSGIRGLLISRIPPDQQQITFRVGVAAGPWELLEVWDFQWQESDREMALIESASPVVLRWPHEEGDAVIVELTHAVSDVAARLVAVDRQGDLHVPKEWTLARGAGIVQRRYTFEGLSLADITPPPGARLERAKSGSKAIAPGQLRFETCPYQWITFKNVSLAPGNHTEPGILLEKPEVKPVNRDESAVTASP